MGDVEPFFREEDGDVHYSMIYGRCDSQWSSRRGVQCTEMVVRDAASGRWITVDLAEPYEPRTHEDELMHPAGIAALSSTTGRVVLAITDGLVVELQLETGDPTVQPSSRSSGRGYRGSCDCTTGAYCRR